MLAQPATRAEVSNLDEPENVYEKGQGRLLEVYRPVLTPAGAALLVETYTTYNHVAARTAQTCSRGFAGVTIISLLLLGPARAPRCCGGLRDRLSGRSASRGAARAGPRRLRRRSAAHRRDAARRGRPGPGRHLLHGGRVGRAAPEQRAAGAGRLDLAAPPARSGRASAAAFPAGRHLPAEPGRHAGLEAGHRGSRAGRAQPRHHVRAWSPRTTSSVDPARRVAGVPGGPGMPRATPTRHSQATRVVVWLSSRRRAVALSTSPTTASVSSRRNCSTAADRGHFGLRLLRDAVATADAQSAWPRRRGRDALAAAGAPVSVGPADMIVGGSRMSPESPTPQHHRRSCAGPGPITSCWSSEHQLVRSGRRHDRHPDGVNGSGEARTAPGDRAARQPPPRRDADGPVDAGDGRRGGDPRGAGRSCPAPDRGAHLVPGPGSGQRSAGAPGRSAICSRTANPRNCSRRFGRPRPGHVPLDPRVAERCCRRPAQRVRAGAEPARAARC